MSLTLCVLGLILPVAVLFLAYTFAEMYLYWITRKN